MAWPFYRETVTVVDVIETGACIDGVKEWLEKNQRQIAGPTEKYRSNGYIVKASHADGYGYGDGDGDGYGYGDGDGDGDGYGYGDGDGDGYGYGYGYGYG
jgi:hypothetical protein